MEQLTIQSLGFLNYRVSKRYQNPLAPIINILTIISNLNKFLIT